MTTRIPRGGARSGRGASSAQAASSARAVTAAPSYRRACEELGIDPATPAFTRTPRRTPGAGGHGAPAPAFSAT
eukprot:7473454-Alexandrium_andersonii.AAC.1